MTRNSSQVFAGGWTQLQHAKFRSSEPTVNTVPAAITWKPDGTKYVIADGNADTIQEYNCSIPHDETSSTPGASFPIPFEANVRGMAWTLDGIQCWIIGTGTDIVREFNCVTPWDVSTMSDSGNTFAPDMVSPNPIGLYVSRDGLNIYITTTNNDVLQYLMTTPYDITTANSTPIHTLDLTGIADNPQDLFFSNDLKYLYIASNTEDAVVRFLLTTLGDVSTGIFVDSVDISPEETVPFGLFIRQDNGKILYVLGLGNSRLYSYDMSLTENNTIITKLGEEITTIAGEPLVAV